MSFKTMSFNKVLVAIDLVEHNADHVLETARCLAGDRNLEVIHVLERGHFYNMGDPALALVDDLHEQMTKEVTEYLNKICSEHGVNDHTVLEGHAATVIQDYAAENGHDLIVMGTHGRHGIKLILGSTANGVLHGTACNVLAVRVPDPAAQAAPVGRKYQRLLTSIDLSDESAQVLDMAQAVAGEQGAELHVVHVIKPFQHAYAGLNPATLADVGIQFEHDATTQATELLGKIAGARGLDSSATTVRHGPPAGEVHRLVDELGADLVVMGTHGKHGVDLLLGSTANAVLHGANCDVLAVRVR
jgi:universal stress protein A